LAELSRCGVLGGPPWCFVFIFAQSAGVLFPDWVSDSRGLAFHARNKTAFQENDERRSRRNIHQAKNSKTALRQ
jgi:hypothetical protein